MMKAAGNADIASPWAKATRGNVHFTRYWTTYLYPDPSDARNAVGMAVDQLGRNGVAHSFAGKDFAVTKEGGHLVHGIGGLVHVNVMQLADDLEQSYLDRAKPYLTGGGRPRRRPTWACSKRATRRT